MAVSVINSWSANTAQPTAGPMPPGLQSVVFQLNVANSVGGGSGTPTAGNWLFCSVGWQQSPAGAPVTFSVADDVHSWWRPQAPSTASANCRTTIWYTPNTAGIVNYIYVAPSSIPAGVSVLVTEVSGLGPWDSVVAGIPGPVGYSTNYGASVTTLNLALGAPSGPVFILGSVTGNNDTATTAFAPASWTALPSVTATDGSDHLCDAVLKSAWFTTSGSISVNGTAGSAESLSGAVISVLQTAPSPIPAAHNPNWPLTKLELGFGSGFQTPLEQITWTDLTSRALNWDETTGVQFQLGQILSTELTFELDNFDFALTPTNTGGPYYSNALNSNMSFESGVSPWGLTDPSAALSAVQSSVQAYSGTYSMFVTPTNTAHSVVLSEQVPATVGSSYTASAWLYSPGGWASGGQVQINWYNASHVYLSTSNNTPTALTAGVWIQVTLTATAPASTAYAQLVVNEAGAVTSANTYYADEAAIVSGTSAVSTHLVNTGTPIRIRFAMGIIGGVTVNRWYVIHRNVLEWPEGITEILRPIINGEGTDGWFDLSSTTNTPYRNEVYWDTPYAWWPCDDQPLAYGVLPTTLLNIANGNTNVLNIQISPNGATLQDFYSAYGSGTNVDLNTNIIGTAHATAPLSVAASVGTYTVGTSQGWMFGDPQSLFNNNIAAGGQATSNPGSAAWQAAGQIGNTGSFGWFLYCNDASFPSVSSGITVEGWFNYAFLGSATGIAVHATSSTYNIAQQPYGALTLLELAGSTNPVIKLQLDTSGHLILLTFNGAASTSHAVYSTSDLRAETWFHVAVEITASTYLVYVNGGLTATVSGAATINTAWTWLIVNGDLAANGGSTAGTGLVHGGNVQVSHLAIYPTQLPVWRILAHYWAAIAGGGLIPAPQSPQITPVQLSLIETASLTTNIETPYTADGTAGGLPGGGNGYGQTGRVGNNVVLYAFALVVVAQAGSYTSGPSAWVAIASLGNEDTSGAGLTYGQYVFTSWTGVAPKFAIYTANAVNAELQAAIVVANSDSFTSAFGASAVDTGPGDISGGSGASPPASPSAIGDTVGQRLERILQQGLYTVPLRSIDPAPLLVQAPGTNGAGLQTGQYLQAIQTSDDGMLYIDNMGFLTYWQKSHLSSQFSSPVWQLGPNTATSIPYYGQIKWILDPHRVWNAISIQPFDPNSAQLPVYTPTNSTGVLASQKQYGPQPLQVVSWLQSQSEMQTQANFLFSTFGQPQRRSENVEIEASAYPAAWQIVAGANVGDIVQMQDWSLGNTGPTYTYRITKIRRTFSYGATTGEVKGTLILQLDVEPNSYWS